MEQCMNTYMYVYMYVETTSTMRRCSLACCFAMTTKPMTQATIASMRTTDVTTAT